MEATRRDVINMGAGVAAAAMLGNSGAALAAPNLGSRSKTMYWVATVTPCDKNGRFDPGAMRSIMQWHKSQGADGVVVLGTSGEFPSFSVAERRLVTETAMKNKNGLNVIVGPGTSNLPETIELAKHAQANGADGLLVIPPFYFNEPPVEGLTRYYSTLMEQCTLPTNLYHIPGTSEVSITLDLLKNLSQFPHLAGIKDSSGSAPGYTAFAQGYPALNMRCGTSNNLEIALDHGMGTILADGNTMSKKCADVFTAYRAKGDWKGALGKLRAANQIMRPASLGGNTYAVMKYVLSLEMGGPEMYARTPYPQLTDAQKSSLKAALARVKTMA
jgi:4-hydroxy-tetrahydrodipicolinate synthase